MRKLSIIASAILLWGSVAHAQDLLLPEASITAGVDIEGTFPHFSSTVAAASGNQSAVLSHFRLIGKVYTKHNGASFITQDSITYKYGYGRGGDVTAEAPNDDQNILFDESYTYEYDAGTNTFINKLKRTQLFDNDNHVTHLTYSNWKDHLFNYKDSARYLYGYSADGKMTSSVAQVWFGSMWTNSVSSKLEYNGSNKITKMSSTWYEVEFQYGTNNNITQVVDKEVKNGKLTFNERKTYTYKNGEVATYTLEKWNDISKNWVNIKKWEYNGTGTPNVDEEVEYNWNGTGWLKYARNYLYYDASRDDVLIERKKQLYDNGQNMFINTRTEIWEYNANNQPTMMTSKTWDASSNKFVSTTNDEQIRFLYEYYNPTAINKVSVMNTHISTYPTPAGNQVTVAVEWDRPQDFDMLLIDMTGKAVYQSHVNATKYFQQSISVASLPSGNYFVKLISAEAQLTERVVVAH